MNADAKAHAPIVGGRACGGFQGLLNGHRSRDRAGCRIEHREDRIARHVDDATLAGLDPGAEDRSGGVQGGHGRLLVRGHQPRVPHYVGGEDRREPLPATGFSP